MGHHHRIVAKDGRNQRRPHARALRLIDGGLINGGIHRDNPLHQTMANVAHPRLTADFMRRACGKIAFKTSGKVSYRHVTRHFPSVITAHAVGKNDQAERRIGKNGIFVVFTHHTRVSANNDFERAAQGVGNHVFLSDSLGLI